MNEYLNTLLTGGQKGESEDAHDQVYRQGGGYDNPDNKAKFSHELIAGGAAFEGFKLYEDHQRKEGKQAHSTQFHVFKTIQLTAKRQDCEPRLR